MLRVFPRRTNATPIDDGVRIGFPYLWDKPELVHISVAFSWDLPKARAMERAWKKVAGTVLMGGPALGTRGGTFYPGVYLREGYTITSRGCPNRCWFCDVWKRDGGIRELPIRDGWNILDDNILATSRGHFQAVCNMLKRQTRRAEFTGGLEAARLTDWHTERLVEVKPKQMFFAYDTDDDFKPLVNAGWMLQNASFSRNHMRCFVLIGYPKDTLSMAEFRLRAAWDAGFLPMAMLYRKDASLSIEWRRFQRVYARPALIKTVMNT